MGNGPCWRWALFNALISAINTLLWLPALLQGNHLTKMAFLWTSTFLFLVALMGIFVFHEPLSFKKYIGLIFTVLAVIFLS